MSPIPRKCILMLSLENRDIHQTIPDHRVQLTSDGWAQAYDAGRRLRALLRPDDKLQFFTSPYRRTRETTEGILTTLTADEPESSPFARANIKVFEEPRLREQDFGNFQPCSAEMERMWQERADYGHFFYRIPNGESAADAYDRVSGFNESLWRSFEEEDFASVCVLGESVSRSSGENANDIVTHGLMSRVFLMRWYHFSVEYFEDLRNVHHCEFLIMRQQPETGSFVLENTLRTWSQLIKDRAAQKEREKSEKHSLPMLAIADKDREKQPKLASSPSKTHDSPSIPSLPFRTRWGGCPNGCDHHKSLYRKENSMDAMQLNGTLAAPSANAASCEPTMGNSRRAPPVRRTPMTPGSGSDDERNSQPDDLRDQNGPPGIDSHEFLNPADASREVIITHQHRGHHAKSKPGGNDGLLRATNHPQHFTKAAPSDRSLAHRRNSSLTGIGSDCDTDYLTAEEDARKRHLMQPSLRNPLPGMSSGTSRGTIAERVLRARPAPSNSRSARAIVPDVAKSTIPEVHVPAHNQIEQGVQDNSGDDGDLEGGENDASNENLAAEAEPARALAPSAAAATTQQEEQADDQEKSVLESVY